jgi:hypothetical protein
MDYDTLSLNDHDPPDTETVRCPGEPALTLSVPHPGCNVDGEPPCNTFSLE